MKIILIDDEPLARTLLKEYLESHQDIEIIAECQDGFQGAKAIDDFQPDLIFLDIQMPKISGFEMLELIDHQPKIIFTTAFDEFALKAFESNAVDYLLKPFSKERFEKAFEKARNEIQDRIKLEEFRRTFEDRSDYQINQIIVKDHGNAVIIPLNEILYIESYDDYVKIHSLEKTYLKKSTLAYYEQQLSGFGFLRVHRSFVLNKAFLSAISTDNNGNHFATLKDGRTIAVSRNGLSDLRNSFIR